MSDPIHLVDQCIYNGLQCLEEAVEFYWPAKVEKSSNKFYPVAENNIALHLARSFTEEGFQVWAEVPSCINKNRLDFLAYCAKENIFVALELKRSIDMPPSGSREDVERLARLRKGAGLANISDTFSSATWVYGVVTVFYVKEFVCWWENPAEYEPKGKYVRSEHYKQLGKYITNARRKTVPFKNRKWENVTFAYALFDENSIGEVKTLNTV